ncbi:MAG TPA: 4'-phosphopantetheinyl transferase superfamily protein [Gemmatimonadales bacterium]
MTGETTMAPAPASRSFRLTADEVQCWCVSLDVPPETSAGLYATLTSDERNRSMRFRWERDRQRFIVAHGVLHDLLGRYLGSDPGHIRFVYDEFGKLELSPEFGGRLKFNLSHSADRALIAVAADAAIGVDLEHIGAQTDYAAIAQCFFSAAEVDQVNRVPSHLRARAFFSCWTKKEAYVKARGEGFAIPFPSFSVPLTTDAAFVSADLHGARWSIHALQPAPGYIGALAIEGSGWRLRQLHW